MTLQRKPRVAPALAILLGISALLAACSQQEEAAPSDVAATAIAEKAANNEDALARIDIRRVSSAKLHARIASSGTIEARRITEVAAELSGRLHRVFVDVGDEVAEGAALFQIDPGPFRMIVAEASAAHELARAESLNADAEAERMRNLVAQAVASEQRYDQLRTVAEVGRARVAAAKARLDRASRDLARTTVRAPYEATVVERRAHEGAMAGMEPILVLQEAGALEAILDVPEATPVAVRAGDPVRLYVEGLADPILSVVSRVSARVDPQTRTYEVRAEVVDASGLVKAGSYARAELEPTRTHAQPVVDASALLNRDGRTVVLRVVDDVVHHVPVRVGIQVDGQAEILSGIEVGDLVVQGDSVVRLADGARVPALRGGAAASRVSTAATGAAEEPGT